MLRARTRLILCIGAAVALLSGLLVGSRAAWADTGSTIVSQGPAPAAADGTVPAGSDLTVSLTVGGVQRSYVLFEPAAAPAGPRPLIVALHYLNATPQLMEYFTRLDVGAAGNGDYVVYPAGLNGSWNGGACCGWARDNGIDDVSFLNAVLDDVQARVPVDSQRISMGGFSNGAIMAYRFACSGDTRVSSYFIGSGVEVAPTCHFGRPLSFLQMHGLKDTAVIYGGSTTNTRFTNGLQPSVPSTFRVHMGKGFLGCTGYTTIPQSPVLTRYSSTGCPAGSRYDLMVSSLLDHRWANGPAAVSTYGMDETGTLFNWLMWSVWASAT